MIDTASSELVLGVVGAGIMGRGIAQVAATGGIQVLLADSRPETVTEAVQFISRMINRAAEKGVMTSDEAAAAIGRIHPVNALQELSPCGVVIEAVFENLAIKQELLSTLESIVSGDCIIASNTSALPITSIAAKCRLPQRVAGTHFFNPVPLMKLVEIINGVLTHPQIPEALVILAKRMGREPVLCADFAGFLAGNIGRGLTLEALRIVEQGVATFEDVDNIVRDVLGFPMGPFQLIDNNGAETVHRAMKAVYEEFYQEPYFRPSPLLEQRTIAGLLGKKTGKGFYIYKDGKAVASSSGTPSVNRTGSVWVSPEIPACRDAVATLFNSLGVAVESGEKPSSSALCVVTPIGEDATGSILRQNLDPRRTIALDALFGLEKRRTCMVNPEFPKQALAEAVSLLSRDGKPTTVIQDSPGFVAQRIIAMIINISSWIVQSNFASPEDVDKAARLGLGYPQGPLSFAEKLGPRQIVSILISMQTRTGDPRYRPTQWLMHRSELGMPLTAGQSDT